MQCQRTLTHINAQRRTHNNDDRLSQQVHKIAMSALIVSVYTTTLICSCFHGTLHCCHHRLLVDIPQHPVQSTNAYCTFHTHQAFMPNLSRLVKGSITAIDRETHKCNVRTGGAQLANVHVYGKRKEATENRDHSMAGRWQR